MSEHEASSVTTAADRSASSTSVDGVVTRDGTRRVRQVKHDMRVTIRLPGSLMAQVRAYGKARGLRTDTHAMREILSGEMDTHSRRMAKAGSLSDDELRAYRAEVAETRAEVAKLTNQVQRIGINLWQALGVLRSRSGDENDVLYAWVRQAQEVEFAEIVKAVERLEERLSKIDL